MHQHQPFQRPWCLQPSQKSCCSASNAQSFTVSQHNFIVLKQILLFQEGVSPLHVAAHYGNVEISKLLLDRGADVDNQAKV